MDKDRITVGNIHVVAGTGDPNAVVSAPRGSLFVDVAAAKLWQNTNGAAAWTPPGPTTVQAHAANHEDGGSDEINVTGLSGLLADPQPPLPHPHNPGEIVPQGDGSGLDADTVDGRHASDVVLRDGSQPFVGDQSMGGHRLTDLGVPTAVNDAASKGYIDDAADPNNMMRFAMMLQLVR